MEPAIRWHYDLPSSLLHYSKNNSRSSIFQIVSSPYPNSSNSSPWLLTNIHHPSKDSINKFSPAFPPIPITSHHSQTAPINENRTNEQIQYQYVFPRTVTSFTLLWRKISSVNVRNTGLYVTCNTSDSTVSTAPVGRCDGTVPSSSASAITDSGINRPVRVLTRTRFPFSS